MIESTHAVVAVDEELWFGNVGDDKELEERAAQSMAAVAARVLGAKPFPAAARKLEELTRDVNTKIEQVVGVLESDPGLSMRLLRLVNSAGYALRVRCTSVRHAASLVGMRRLHQLATTAAVLDLFETDNPAIKSLLGHAAVVGAFCRYLAVHVDLGPDELFTCGFLHDIGKLMLIDAEGEPYLDLVRQAGDSPDALHVLEQQHFGFDHAVLGAHVLKNWRIPNPVPRVVAWHHNVARAYQADPGTASMVQTLRLADQLSYLVRTSTEAEGIVLAAQSPAASYLGVSEAQLSSMWADLSRLSQRIHATPGADQGELIPREESIPPQMRGKKRSRKSVAPVRSLPPGTFSAAPRADVEGSLPAPSLPPSATGPISEMPKHFVCVVCHRASFGNRCPVCSGHVCAKHQVGAEQWCTDCATAYRLDVGANAFPLWERLTALGIVLGAGTLSVVVAVLAGRPVLGALVGSTLLASLCILLVVVGRRFWLKRMFLLKRGQVPVSDEPALPLGLTMPPEPAIAMREEPPLAVRPTVPARPADLPALFSMVPTSDEPLPPASVAVAPPPPSMAAPPPVPPEASSSTETERFSSPAPAHALVATQSDAVPREAIPTVPSRRRATPFAHTPSFAPRGEAEPAKPAVTAPAALSDSLLPEAAGWRPVERTEPASRRSKSPSEIQRLADTLPSLPPAPDVPVIEEPPPSVAVPAPLMTSPHPSLTTALSEPTRTSPSLPPTESEASAPPPSSEPSSERGPQSALPYAEDSGLFAAAACHPVDRSQLVACRPVSARPTAYACSRML
jgi:HD-like signal output (HDOD) protein